MTELIVKGKVHQFVSSNGEMSCKPVLVLLHKYRNTIISIYQIDFTVSSITSAFKHQSPFVFQERLIRVWRCASTTSLPSDTRTQWSEPLT